MNKITNQELSFAVNNCNVNLKTHLDTYTRETSTQLCVATLFQRNITPTIELIDDLSFLSFGFPISHRKYSPLKNKGGKKAMRRVDCYLYNNELMHYDINSNTFNIDQKIADIITSKEKIKARKHFLFKLRENRVINPVKNKAITQKGISNPLFYHLTQSKKYSY